MGLKNVGDKIFL